MSDDGDDDDDNDDDDDVLEKQEGTLPAHILSRERASLDTPGTRKGVGNHRSSMMMTPMLMMITMMMMAMMIFRSISTSTCLFPHSSSYTYPYFLIFSHLQYLSRMSQKCFLIYYEEVIMDQTGLQESLITC